MSAYRFENPEVVGEFTLGGVQTVDEFLAEFDAVYGTEPTVVAAIITVPVADLAAVDAEAKAPSTNVARAADFVAPPADAAKMQSLFADHRPAGLDAQQSAESDAEQLWAPGDWRPEYAEVEVIRLGADKVNFIQYYTWDGSSTSSTALHDTYGLEFQVDITTDEPGYQTDHRPICAFDYKDRPFAKNYNWTWYASVNTGSGLVGMSSSFGVYADYNDLADDCNRSSMAIGIKEPQDVPSYPNGQQEVLFSITAGRGLDDTGEVSGTVQSINKSWCNDVPLMALTDCMGVAAGTDGERITLNASRGFIAPNKCWQSANRGQDAPVVYC